jgi:hypothetical protein
LAITGANKYEVRYISVASPDEQSNAQPQKDQRPPSPQILAISALSTFYTNTTIHKAYMINMNTTVILSKGNLIMVSQSP